MRQGQSTSPEEVNDSGGDPNLILLVGDGPRAEFFRRALESTWRVISLDPSHDRPRNAVYVEAAGDHRHEQLAALRQISAEAPDDAVIISTSPILSQSEIAESVTQPGRLVGLVPPWSNRSPLCEVIQSAFTTEKALNQALKIANAAGWTSLTQRHGGPSALTRLCGSVMIGSWNLAQRTGRPDEIDRAARQWGLTWLPLREIDRIGLARLAATFDRGGQVVGIDSVYASLTDEAASVAFQAKCGNDLIEATAAIGYFLEGAVEAAWSLVMDELASDPHSLQRLLAAAFGRRVGRQVSRAVSARYPEMTIRLPVAAPA